MVPKASEDLPEPETPENTTSALRGMETSTSLRLCSRAPRTSTRPFAAAEQEDSPKVGFGMFLSCRWGAACGYRTPNDRVGFRYAGRTIPAMSCVDRLKSQSEADIGGRGAAWQQATEYS